MIYKASAIIVYVRFKINIIEKDKYPGIYGFLPFAPTLILGICPKV